MSHSLLTLNVALSNLTLQFLRSVRFRLQNLALEDRLQENQFKTSPENFSFKSISDEMYPGEIKSSICSVM